MATKTISVDLEAYEHLRRAKIRSKESFSNVIKRAVWLPEAGTAGSLLALTNAMDSSKFKVPARVLDELDKRQEEDSPSEDRWKFAEEK
jgi:hypothetical protein